MISVRTATGISEIGAVFIRTASGLEEISEIHVRDGAGLSLVWQAQDALTATISGDPYGSNGSDSAISVTTAAVSCVVAGGKAPYSFLWTRTDNDPASWVIITPTAQTTQFRAVSVGSGVSRTATFKCAVTDSSTPPNSDDTTSITATAENFGGFQ